MPTDKPICGSTGLGAGRFLEDMSLLTVIWAIFGFIGSVYTIGSLILGGSAMLGAILGGGGVFVIVFAFYLMHCIKKREGPAVCTTGIINRIVPSFSSDWDYVFPFSAMHTRFDVVVNPVYWPEVEDGAGYIFCANDPAQSPILSGFYKDKTVCAAKLGATFGALTGAVIGIVLALIVGCGLAAWLCAIIALLIVAIIALVGAIVGGHIGKTQSEGRALPADPDLIDPILVGDHVAHIGTLVVHPEFDRAKVYWFVDVTKQMGKSFNSPPFSAGEAALVWGCNLPIVVL
jgi:hypothetical protein